MTNIQPSEDNTKKRDRTSDLTTDARRQLRHQRTQNIIKYLGLGGIGFGGAGIAGLWLFGQPIAAFVLPSLITVGCTILAIAYKFVSGVTNRVLDKIEELLEDLEEPSADWIVKQLKTGVIALWWKFNSKFRRDYYQSLIDNFRSFRIDGFRVGLPVLDLEDVFVPLRVMTGTPEKISGAMIQTHHDAANQEIWDFLRQLNNKGDRHKFSAYRRLAVVGAPGSGKTTLLKHLALIFAKERYKDEAYQVPKLIPVLLYLRDIRDRIVAENPLLVEVIESHIRSLPSNTVLNPPMHWIDDQLRLGNCLVMLDGLDEVADKSQRQDVSQWVNRQMQAYPKTPFILTSRPDGYNSAPVDMVGTVLKVLPFTHEQVKKFINCWYEQTEILSNPKSGDTPAVRAQARKNAEDLIDRIIDNRAIADMATNPLLVTMIATVHYNGSALPGRRVELYQKICDVLLGARQVAKGKINTSLTGVQNKAVLQVLSLSLMQGKTREFSLPEGEGFIREELVKVSGSSLTAEKFLLQIKEICGLLVERELGIYEFAHLSFQEYLAAAEIKELQRDDLLTGALDDSWWAETIRLYAAQGDATNLIEAAIAKPTVKSLSLAFDCLQEAAKVESVTRQKLSDLLESGLESEDPQIANLAAEVSLLRRLNNLCKVDENLEIDLNYITCTEFQLFYDEQFISPATKLFKRGNERNPITNVDFGSVLRFCTWLNLKDASLRESSVTSYLSHYYRLLRPDEIEKYPAKSYSHLDCWTLEQTEVISPTRGIRIVRAPLAQRYRQLAKYLIAQEWEKADQETAKVMLATAGGRQFGLEAIEKFPCEDIQTLDHLWLYYSRGQLSLGIQMSFWERIGNPPPKYLAPRLDFLNISTSPREFWSALARRSRNCHLELLSFERTLPRSEFEVVTVDERGQEVERKIYQSKYFSEDLAKDLSLDMVLIPAGSFVMGSPKSEKDSRDDERPQHQVNVPEFFMGKYQVTQAQWRVVAAMPEVNHDLKPDPSHFKGDNRPVENVSWDDVMEFCARLSQHTGREYRLPSEAQWEYACRAGTTTPFHFGETITPELVNYDSNEPYGNAPKGEARNQTTPVGSFPPNAFGLYDMHGNVWEWCADDWHTSYKGAPTDGSIWLGETTGDRNLKKHSSSIRKSQNIVKTRISFVTRRKDQDQRKMLRGGSWYLNAQYCRSAFRHFNDLARYGYALNAFGFRVVCVVR